MMTTETRESAPTPRWAVTMFSFTNEMAAGERSTSELLDDVLGARLADAVEVDAAQHFPGFPRISDEEITLFRRIVDTHGAVPTMLGGYVDARIDPPGPRSDEEKAEFLLAQVRAASRMGFFGVRVGLGTMTPALSDLLLPHLDDLDVRILEEVQAGALPGSPAIDRTMTYRDHRGTDRIGFVFDSSLVMEDFPVTWIAALEEDGVPHEAIDQVRLWWRTRDPDGWPRTQELIQPLTVSASSRRRLEMPFRRFGCSSIAAWSEFLPHVTSVHLKYWDLEDEGGRISLQTRAVFDALRDIGYDGFVCSEWGGHDWLEVEDHSALEMTRRHRELVSEVAALRS